MIDAFASFSKDKIFKAELIDIARVGRKYGIHLIVARQRPCHRVMDDQIKANLPASLAFGVRNKGNAEVLSALGAEKLLVMTPKAWPMKHTGVIREKGSLPPRKPKERITESPEAPAGLLRYLSPLLKRRGEFFTLQEVAGLLEEGGAGPQGDLQALGRQLAVLGLDRGRRRKKGLKKRGRLAAKIGL